MEPGNRVKLTGTKIIGMVVRVYGERGHGSSTKKMIIVVKHDSDGKEMEYTREELRYHF